MGDLGAVTAVLLAGGLGTRLRPSLADRPKVLAPVGGRPFIAYLLDQLGAAGVRQAVLCVGYLGEQVEAALGSEQAGVRLSYSYEPTPLGTGGALRRCAPKIHAEELLVLNGDSFCDVDLRALHDFHTNHGAPGTLVLTHVPDAGRYGQVELGSNGVIRSFREKAAAGGPGWINAGLALLPWGWLTEIDEGVISLEQELWPRWIARGVHGFTTRGRFIDIGTPASLAQAQEVLL